MTDITKEGLKHLNKVFRFKKRTIAVCGFKNSAHLKESWEDAQLEFCGEYQYASEKDNIWDYYLILCCPFPRVNLDLENRLSIENDKFCCRKFFLFDTKLADCTPEALLKILFPPIEVSSAVDILKPESLISSITDNSLVSPSFFIKTKTDEEITTILQDLLKD